MIWPPLSEEAKLQASHHFKLIAITKAYHNRLMKQLLVLLFSSKLTQIKILKCPGITVIYLILYY